MVQAVADASFKFLDVSTGFPGSIHDARIIRLSKLHREVGQGNWLNGPSKQIGPCNCEVGPLLVGDSFSLIKVVNETFQANSYIN